jgi:uncharacterized protein YciI
VDFLIHSRVTAEAARSGPDDALNVRHWAYLDRFADRLTARGPTLAPDRETWTGSMHVLDLPSVDDAHAFVADEPYARAGLFASHRIWRFTNLLGRTMWEHPGDPGGTTYLVFTTGAPLPLADEQLLMSGELRTLDGEPAGHVAAAGVVDRSVLDDLTGATTIDWERGGRR